MKVSSVLVLISLLPLFCGSSTLDDACPLCALYTVGQLKGHTSRILGLDLRSKKSCFLGGQVNKEIGGLAVDPQSGMYAVTNPGGHNSPGILHHVDRTTGTLTPIGQHQFKSITDLAFRWNDMTLWGWAEGDGLVQFDTLTGEAVLRYQSKKKFSGFTWANNGSILYAIYGNKELWSYRELDKRLERVSMNLPEHTSAIEMRSDGLLTGITTPKSPKGRRLKGKKGLKGKEGLKGTKFLWSFIYDPISLKVISNHSIPSPDDVLGLSGLAWPRACGIPTPGGQVDMIQSVTIDPYPQACIGEDVKVTVEAVHPLSADQGIVDISINDLPSNPQYLKFMGQPGDRLIGITASTKEQYFDFKSFKVEVVDCAGEFLELAASMNPFSSDTINFEVINAKEFGGQSPLYQWDFGDGPVNTGNVPYTSYVYAELVRGEGRDQLLNSIQATVKLSRAGYADLIARKIVPLWNMYAENKERGVIQLIVETDGLLQQDNNAWTGSYNLVNIEDEPITLTLLQLSFIPCDPDLRSISRPPEIISIELPEKQPSMQTISIPVDQMVDMCGADIFLSGPGKMGQQVQAAVYFITAQRNPVTLKVESDEALRQLLNYISDQGLVSDRLRITDEELYALARKQDIIFPPAASTKTQNRTNSQLAQANDMCILTSCDPRTDENNCIGMPCLPGDPTRAGVSCQVTEDWCTAPAHIANALKGDIIASVGCGMIGNLLRKLSPKQQYSHVGIMTRNHYEVTHSTSASQRYEAYMAGFEDSDGVIEGALLHGWPGVITQSISNAFNGEQFQDPIDGKMYEILGFSSNPQQCKDETSFVYSLVVKPPPGSSVAVREKLIATADTALNVANSDGGHYRFYAYSNADIAESYAAPSFIPQGANWVPSKGWAENSLATVCSQFIWYCLKLNSITLEGQLDEADVSRGAMIDGNTTEGLYLYTEEERLDAGEWLFGFTYNKVYDKAGWFGDLITDAADNIANQLVNCFALDDCEVDTSENKRWKEEPSIGRAVSPDDIIWFWDTPDQGGVYGYNEPLVYRGGDHLRVTTWQVSEGVGTAVITVLDRGQAVEAANIEIAGISGATDATGEFRDDKIPGGTYEVYAYKLIGGYFKSVRETVTITADSVTSVTLNLQLPPQYIRRVTISGTMKLIDDEVGDDETMTFNVNFAQTLDIYERDKLVEIDECVGGEVRGELKFNLHLSESDNTTVELRKVSHDSINAHFWLYEGTNCDTDDLETAVWWYPLGDPEGIVAVPAGALLSLSAVGVSEGIGGGDKAVLDLSVSNYEETFP